MNPDGRTAGGRKPLLLCLALAALAFGRPGAAAAAEEARAFLIGNWKGTVNAGLMTFTLVFRFRQSSDATVTGTMDILEQDEHDIPVDAIEIRDGMLTLEMRRIRRTFAGRIGPGHDIVDGRYLRDGLMSLPLVIRKVSGDVTLNRPQTPQPPFPYREEPVTFRNETDRIGLSGTLSIPDGGGPFPALVLISGSGAQDRDETGFGHKPFRLLADHLARAGVAVLRYDDRGVGGSAGDHLRATSATNAADVAAAVRLLRSRKDIREKGIGLLGHSEGGAIAVIAAGSLRHLAGIVLLGAPGVPIEENLFLQNELIRRAEGMSDETIARFHAVQKRIFSLLKTEADDNAARAQLREAYSGGGYPSLPDEQQRAIDGRIDDVMTPYFRDIIRLQPGPFLRRLRCPVLAITGALDLQAPPRQNLAAISTALESGRNRDFQVVEMPGLNHMLQTARTGTISEYARIEETIAPAVLKTVTEWFLARTGSRGPRH